MFKTKIKVPHEKMDWSKSDGKLAKIYDVSRTRISQIRKKLFGTLKRKTPMQDIPPAVVLPKPADQPQASLPLQDESIPSHPAESEAMDIEKVLAASGSTFQGEQIAPEPEQFQQSQPKISASNFEDERPAEIAAAPAGNPAAASLFRKVVVNSIKGGVGIAQEVTRTMAGAAGIDPAFTEKTLQRAKIDQEEAMSDFQESLDLCMQKYKIQPKHAEEICLAISGARLFAPYGLMIVEFRAEIARNRAKHFKLPAKE